MTITLTKAVVGQPIEWSVTTAGLYTLKVTVTPSGAVIQFAQAFVFPGMALKTPWQGTVPSGSGCVIDIELEKTIDVISKVIKEPSVVNPPVEPPVEPPPVVLQSITISPNTTSVEVDQYVQLSAVGNYSNGTSNPIPGLSWVSGDVARATVNSSGLVTGKSAGVLTVTAVSGPIIGSCAVTVTAKPVVVPPPTGDTPYPATADLVGWKPTGVTLTPYSGPSTITTAGTIIEGKDITTSLDIRANDVTIRKCRITASGDFLVKQTSGARFLFEDNEIVNKPGTFADRAILVANTATIRRCWIHGTQRFIYLAGGSGCVVEGNFISDNVNTTEAHTSGIGSNGGVKQCKIINNVIQTSPNTNASSALSLYPETNMGGAGDDILIEGNLINTGGGYGVYLGHTPPELPHKNLRFINNFFGTLYNANCGTYGPCASWSPTNTWTNNKWKYQGNGSPSKDGTLVSP